MIDFSPYRYQWKVKNGSPPEIYCRMVDGGAEYCDKDIDPDYWVFVPDGGDMDSELDEYHHMLWTEYATADDESLTPEACKLKQRILARIEPDPTWKGKA